MILKMENVGCRIQMADDMDGKTKMALCGVPPAQIPDRQAMRMEVNIGMFNTQAEIMSMFILAVTAGKNCCQ